MKFSPAREGVRIAALVVVSALIWCVAMNRSSLDSWQVPLTYTEHKSKFDVLYLYAMIKATAEGHLPFLGLKMIPELGAPHGAQWNDYPSIEEPLFFSVGMLARVIGVFAAANVACMIAQVLAAVSFDVACRMLGGSPAWSFAGALVFGFAHYGFAQNPHHLILGYFWHLPFCLVVCRWITLDGLTFGTRRFAFACAVALATGAQNVYYSWIFLQLVMLGVLVQLARGGWRWRTLVAPLMVCEVVVLSFALMNVDTMLYRSLHGLNPRAVVRHYSQVEFYSLKILDMLIPFPEHRLGPAASWAQGYYSRRGATGETPPPAYLGIVAIAGLVWLGVVSFLRLAKTPTRPIPLEAGQVNWVVLFATIGGLNALIASLGFAMFRATTRYSIVILALSLMFLVRTITRLGGNRPLLARAGALGVVVLALWDQLPPRVSQSDMRQVAQAVEADRVFTERLERRLPPGAMVFQLPIVEFPESPIPGVSSYDHFRPYLFSRRLRFSHGSVKGRRDDDWQLDLRRVGLPEFLETVERIGFSAVYVNRKGYRDGGASLIQAFEDLGRREIIENSTGDLFCVFLKPRPEAQLETTSTAP